MPKWRALLLLSMVLWGSSLNAGFRSPESLVRNVYAYYGDGASALSSGLPHDAETAQQFFDYGLQQAWMAATVQPYDFLVQSKSWKIGTISSAIIRKQFDKTYVAVKFTNNARPITLNFILANGPEGWIIIDVESPYDSLRAFLMQYKK